MNKRLRIALLAVAALVAFSFVRDFALKAVITAVGSNVVGAPVRMQGFSMSLIRQSVRIGGLRIYNPPGFPQGVLADIPRVAVDLDPWALIGGKLHLQSAEIEVKEVVLIKNKEGKSNVDSLKVARKEEKKEEKKPAKQMPMQIDLLTLKMGRVVQKDYAKGDPPSVQVHEIGLEKKYKNITNPYMLGALILSEPLKQAGLRSLAIHGAAALTGVGLIPLTAASIFAAPDGGRADFTVTYDAAYQAASDLLGRLGTLKQTDQGGGVIKADLPSAAITVRFERMGPATTRVEVSARKYMLPKKDVAQGILYQLAEKLK